MRHLILSASILLLTGCAVPQANPTSVLDGHDCTSAIPVANVDEEYAYLRRTFPGFKLQGQSLSPCEKNSVDILKIQLPDGTQRSIYFNIQTILDGYKKTIST